MSEACRFRAFLAVPSSREWVESARDLSSRLRAGRPEASWTRPQGWHLTLAFLGEVTAEQADRLARECAGVSAAAAPGDLRADHAVVFPPRGRARVLGVGFAPGAGLEAISALARSVAAVQTRAGIPPERRPFHPHVTLARLRDCWPDRDVEDFRAAVQTWSFPIWPARELVLFESQLHPSGAVHTPRGRWTLGEAITRAAG